MKTTPRPLVTVLALTSSLLWGASARGADGPPVQAPIAIEAIVIEPAAPAVDTLCKLRVALKSTADQTLSSLRFTVTINGKPLPVYRNQVFVEPVAPGKVTEIKLYNFWTTETNRPAPADSKLVVEVKLDEARWMKMSTDPQGVEVWELGEGVPGLPVAKSVTIALAKSK